MVSASIVILNYNTRQLTLELLARVAEPAHVAGWQVIVVDNGSQDDGAPAIAEAFPRVELLRAEANRGYAAGNNIGLRQACGESVFLLNSDVIVDLHALEQLRSRLIEEPSIGAVSPGLRTSDQQPQAFAYGDPPSPGYLLRRVQRRLLRQEALHAWDVCTAIDVGWVSGACLGVRTAAICQVGLMDEEFFLYFEDVDWCLRMRTAGWRIVYDPTIQVVHLGGVSQPQRRVANEHYYRSLLYFYSKHYGRFATATLRVAIKANQARLRRHEGASQ